MQGQKSIKFMYLWCKVRKTSNLCIYDARSEKHQMYVFMMHGQKNIKFMYLWCTVRKTWNLCIYDARSEKHQIYVFMMHGQENIKFMYLWCTVWKTSNLCVYDARSEKHQIYVFMMHGQENIKFMYLWCTVRKTSNLCIYDARSENIKFMYLWCTVRKTSNLCIYDARSEKHQIYVFMMHGQKNIKFMYFCNLFNNAVSSQVSVSPNDWRLVNNNSEFVVAGFAAFVWTNWRKSHNVRYNSLCKGLKYENGTPLNSPHPTPTGNMSEALFLQATCSRCVRKLLRQTNYTSYKPDTKDNCLYEVIEFSITRQ